jgi:hypothetical protein
MGIFRRIVVFSDVHANDLALKAVLDDLILVKMDRPVDGYWGLGDYIGRGPNPVEALKLIRPLYEESAPADQAAWLLGNHDLIALDAELQTSIGGESMAGMQPYVIEICKKHGDTLAQYDRYYKAGSLGFLHSLSIQPNTPFKAINGRTVADLPDYLGVYLAHGVYYYNEDRTLEWEQTWQGYPYFTLNIRRQFKDLTTHKAVPPRLIINAHTHISCLEVWDEGEIEPRWCLDHKKNIHEFDLTRQRVAFNPGSIGFPRLESPDKDLNPADDAPTYAILELEIDEETNLAQWMRVEFRAVPYDWRTYFTPETGKLMTGIYQEHPHISKEIVSHRLPDGLFFDQSLALGGNLHE